MRMLAFLIRIAWRHVSGRWFIFRDEPYDLVKRLADCAPEDSDGDDCKDMHQQAKQEIASRDRRIFNA